MQVLSPNTPEMAVAEDLFQQYPFTSIVLTTDSLPVIGQLVFTYEPSSACFYSHLAKNNPLCKTIKQGFNQACLIFCPEHGYVSPTWSSEIFVPTWDYCAVNVFATAEIIEDEAQVRQQLIKQTEAMEGDHNIADNWQINKVADEQQPRLLKQLAVIKLSINQMQYRYKMSQAKPAGAKAAILANFGDRGDHAMVKRYQHFFKP